MPLQRIEMSSQGEVIFRIHRNAGGVFIGSIPMMAQRSINHFGGMYAVFECLVDPFRAERIEDRSRIADRGPHCIAGFFPLRH